MIGNQMELTERLNSQEKVFLGEIRSEKRNGYSLIQMLKKRTIAGPFTGNTTLKGSFHS